MEQKVVVELKNEDMAALYRYIVSLETAPIKKRIYSISVFLVLCILTAVLFNVGNIENMKTSLFYAAIISGFIIVTYVFPGLLHKATEGFNEKLIMKQSPKELQIEGTKQYSVNKSGLFVGTVYGDLEISPEEIEDFRLDGKHIFIKCVKGKGAHVIPVKYFSSEEKREKFLDALAALTAGLTDKV